MDRRRFLTAGLIGGMTLATGCATETRTGNEPVASDPDERSPGVTSVAAGLNVPWAITFLRNGDALVSQRDDASVVTVSADGTVRTVGDVSGVAPRGEGGLQGLAMRPGDESAVYAYYTTDRDNRVARMDFDGTRLGPPRPILTGLDTAYNHHGGALLFDAAGSLFVAVGDAAQPDVSQDRRNLNGKILRLTPDGKPWPDNPFGNEVYSYGHRNVEGLAFDRLGRLWATEFGANSTDELNRIRAGGNYGWPIVEGASDDPRFVAPHTTWTTAEASPAGLAIVGDRAYVAALRGTRLWSVDITDESAGRPNSRLDGTHGRLRAVASAPDGSLWVGTSNTDGRGQPSRDDDRILRISPW